MHFGSQTCDVAKPLATGTLPVTTCHRMFNRWSPPNSHPARLVYHPFYTPARGAIAFAAAWTTVLPDSLPARGSHRLSTCRAGWSSIRSPPPSRTLATITGRALQQRKWWGYLGSHPAGRLYPGHRRPPPSSS
jgi:hypothetical protein